MKQYGSGFRIFGEPNLCAPTFNEPADCRKGSLKLFASFQNIGSKQDVMLIGTLIISESDMVSATKEDSYQSGNLTRFERNDDTKDSLYIYYTYRMIDYVYFL